MTIGATGQGMVAGDMVNTASRLQSAAPPGSLLVDEATMRAASVAITFEPAGEKVLKGKELPVSAWRADRVVADAGRREPQRGARAAVRRTRRRDADPQGAAARDRARAQSPAGVVRRGGRDRQDPPGLGVPQVHRRRRRGRSTGTRDARPPTARASRSGRSARWSGSGPGWPSPTTRRRRASGSPRPSPSTSPTRRSDAGSSRASSAARRRGGPRRRARGAVRGVADVLRARRRPGPDDPRLRGPPMGRPGLLDFIDHLLEWSRAHRSSS